MTVDGFSAATLQTQTDSDVQNGIRMTPVDVCVGPEEITASYILEHEGSDPFVPTDVFFCGLDGTRYEIEGTIRSIVGRIIEGRTGEVLALDLRVSYPDVSLGGSIMIWAADSDESKQEGELVYRLREYELLPSALFADVDRTTIALNEAFTFAGSRPCEQLPLDAPTADQLLP